MVAITEVFRVYLARGYFCPQTIPLNFSCRAESNELSPGSVTHLAGKISPFLALLTATACHLLEPDIIRFVSSGGFKWSASQLDPTAGGGAIF